MSDDTIFLTYKVRLAPTAAQHLAMDEARRRSTHLHQVTANLTSRFSTIVIEDLRPKNMMRGGAYKRGLNRSLADASFGRFRELLSYKVERTGGRLIVVDPRHTSQTCSVCGVVAAASRNSQSSFVCTACGHVANADHNAAINIAHRGGIVPDGLNVGSLSHA